MKKQISNKNKQRIKLGVTMVVIGSILIATAVLTIYFITTMI